MGGVCGDNRFEVIAKVKEHLIKATNIESQPKELEQLDNILFRLWQLDYFNLEAIPKLKEEIEDWKACHEHQLELMKGANTNIEQKKKQLAEKDEQIADLEQEKCELLGIIQGKDKVIAQTKELLRRVVEWADWQSGSKCPSFKEIEKDIKAFLEEKKNEDVKTNNQ